MPPRLWLWWALLWVDWCTSSPKALPFYRPLLRCYLPICHNRQFGHFVPVHLDYFKPVFAA